MYLPTDIGCYLYNDNNVPIISKVFYCKILFFYGSNKFDIKLTNNSVNSLNSFKSRAT